MCPRASPARSHDELSQQHPCPLPSTIAVLFTENQYTPKPGIFADTAEPYRYWQAIVSELRRYAKDRYNQSIFITSNGVFPFVDFHSVGLYPYNHDDDGGAEAPYVPVLSDANPRLDGTRSLKRAFLNLKARSEALAPGAPVVLFIDWPSKHSASYLGFTTDEQKDYWRIYAAEAYANGLFFAFFLRDTIGDKTATDLGLLPFFKGLTSFYHAHASLYHNVTTSSAVVTTSLASAMVSVSDQSSPNRRLVNIVNHEYKGGLVAQSDVVANIPSDIAPSAVTLASPDAAQDMALSYTYAGRSIKVTVPSLMAYAIVVVAY